MKKESSIPKKSELETENGCNDRFLSTRMIMRTENT